MQNLGAIDGSGQFAKLVKAAKDAKYTVDGVSVTSSTNQVTLAEGGTDHATITLTGTGTTMVSNRAIKSVMQNLRVLTSSGDYRNVLKQVQDARYKVDGTNHTSGGN
ncbi:hypothetical protein [Effusibacillus lacus]|uniref:Uncharacterized protein n=1 Tax=Effusibacillus lacus TaxID=1348429 RepID=A0A292YIF6_9BACL|nr:hypothetical protein [Effusibacillus lacus]GAX89688.1 hypothetical protein EFBL_1312 [Effusibacillus lacus]